MISMLTTTLLGALAGGALAVAIVRDTRASLARRRGQPTHVDASGYRTAGR